jgi:hypothetical protein
MTESPFGFRYNWEDLRPIHPLMRTVIAVQILGMAFGYFLDIFPSWQENVLLFAVLLTFPGFLLGLLIQIKLHPGSVTLNKVMVRRGGLVSLLFFAVGLVGIFDRLNPS